jgi:hypothetical protein
MPPVPSPPLLVLNRQDAKTAKEICDLRSLPSHRKTRIISHKYGVFAMSPKFTAIFGGLKTQKPAISWKSYGMIVI